MKVWIIGAQGMLGQDLVHVCAAKKIAAQGTTSREANVTSLEELMVCAEKIKPTHIVNCAAFTNVDEAEKVPDEVFAINGKGAGNVALTAKAVKAKLVHISTDYVFDGKHSVPYVESDRCAPVNCYGKSKWEGEKQVLNILPSGCVLRASWFFGKGRKNFIYTLLEQMRTHEEISVVSDQVSSPTYSADLAHVVIKMLDAEGIYHFCNNGGAARAEVAQEVLRIVREEGLKIRCQKILPVPASFFPTRAERPHYSLLDTHKISLFLGEDPRPWQEAFREYLAYVSFA